ncbi:hypothetical protein CUS_5710 [Ruminococcus albus 8]|uniref:Uncharacterized protein n=1 Tax=Ruminococcus albus 8 TaxID=246199 RepID=E9SGN4_RUMAL|nr:hypothetical protein CUS_5710 [Ruminococcus albus 8]
MRQAPTLQFGRCFPLVSDKNAADFSLFLSFGVRRDRRRRYAV